jgi:hypothetical protein
MFGLPLKPKEEDNTPASGDRVVGNVILSNVFKVGDIIISYSSYSRNLKHLWRIADKDDVALYSGKKDQFLVIMVTEHI